MKEVKPITLAIAFCIPLLIAGIVVFMLRRSNKDDEKGEEQYEELDNV